MYMAQGGRAAETHFMPHNPSSTNTFFLTSHLSTAESLYLLSVFSYNFIQNGRRYVFFENTLRILPFLPLSQCSAPPVPRRQCVNDFCAALGIAED
jgi:hypothetical protein